MASASSSRSDIEVLQSSNRSKLVVLGALVAVAGGAYFLTRGGPIGAPEEASSIMIVTQGSYHYRHSMEELGFKVLEQRQAAFVDKAKEVMPELAEDEALDDVAAILKLADYGGYGYVAFENPQTVDFSKLDVDGEIPTFADHHRFAVVSAGDYAFPHRLTVTAERSEVVPGIDLDLLTALFEQEPLHAALTDDPKGGAEVIILKNDLEAAIERVRAIDEAAKTIAKIEEASRELLVDSERGKVKPALLGSLHESIHPVALADGGVLVPSREANFTSKNGLSADLDLDDTWRFFYLKDASGEAEREPCAAIFGGALEQAGRRPRLRESPGGDAFLFDQSGASTLFTFDAGAGSSACAFRERGALPRLGNRREDPGTPHVSGWVARSRHEGAGVVDAVVELVEPGDGPPIDLLRSTRVGVSNPFWLDADHVTVVASYREGPAGQSVLILSRNHPGVALEIGPQVIAGSYNIFTVAAAPNPGAETPRLVVVAAGPHEASLFRLDLPNSYAALFDAALAEAGPAEPAAEGEPLDVRILPIDPESFAEAVRLTEGHSAADPVVSPDGKWVAYVTRDHADEADSDYEVALAPMSGDGEARLLTQNGLDDHYPMFTGDSRRVVFKTKYPIERTTWTLTTGRSLPVE